MANAFLGIVLQNLNSLIIDEIGLVMGVDQEMKKLLSTFTTIQAVLEDAEMKKMKNKAIANWLGKLKDLVFEIDDILDECATHVSKLKLKNCKLSPKKLLFRFKIARRIRSIAEKLDAVAAERAKFHLQEMATVGRSREVDATRVTSSILNESHQLYGREKDQEKIVKMLVNGVKDNQQISVLPIIGVGGLGKTTLAQSIYNDQRVVEHFEKRLWVCVSDNFDQKTLVRALIESTMTSGCASDLLQLDPFEQRLRGLLIGKRYLLVLDDVWNTDQEKWYVLKNILACGSNGTSIIVTTRLKRVSEIMGTLTPHCLEGLSEEHCWMLMRERAFAEDEKEKYPHLEAIGKQIVKKCAGVPMAAKALGGLLRFKRDEKKWNYVKKSELWKLPEEETLILPVLRLSYHHLPLELRHCFAYFAVFPKDYTIKKEELINLWMSHGYITSNEEFEAEDVGNQICDELLLRSLFQNDRFITDSIMMHDLVHDLAQSIMENKVPGVQVERQYKSSSNTKIRQVNLRNNLVAFPSSTQHDMDISSILTKFSHLRVLDAGGRTTINDLPSNVGNLKHLRFLNLSSSNIRTLPSSLCNLWNLQVLYLNYCMKLVALPKKMRYLKNLRHLYMEGCESLEGMPKKIGELTSLKTLTLFIVGGDKGNQLEELQCLNLGGRLEIKNLERGGSYMDAKKANLVQKKELRDLILEWESNDGEGRGDKDENVLEALQPPLKLQTLTIRGFSGRCFPLWTADSSFKNLSRILIQDCPHILHVSHLGKLPHLKILKVENGGVEYLMIEDVDTQLFPSLERLYLCRLRHLKGVAKEPLSTNVFPNLRVLKIESCSSITLPQLPFLQELDVQNCGGLNLTSLAKLEALTDLRVGFGENMKSIPMEILEKLSNLKSLVVFGAEDETLPEEGMRALKSLKQLHIERSERMRCLPGGWLRHLTSLESLVVRHCPELVELPKEIKELKYLQSVELVNIGKMQCLPKASCHLSSLKRLFIINLHQLNTLPLWLDELTSLESLYIDNCPKLVSLPTCVKEMPNLRSLIIRECPEELKRKCERGSGEEWHKISHISKVLIN